MTAIVTYYDSTPALWMAHRDGQCFCVECRGKANVGQGKTEKAAVIDLLEKELAEQGIEEVMRGRT